MRKGADDMDMTVKTSTKRAVSAIVLSILVLIAAQLVSVSAGTGIASLTAQAAFGNVAAAGLYPLLTVLGLRVLCNKILRCSLADCGISKCKIKPVWGICAICMPTIVIIAFLFVPGHWENSAMEPWEAADALTGSVLFTGFAVGFVEEAVFRGVIMKVLEMRWNRVIAVLVPSVMFGALHVIGTSMDFVSFLQLVIAGSAVGIWFSLVTYESGSIWSNAFIHSIWNICMGSGILYINMEASENSIFNYVLYTDSFLISGGDFGVEASCISIVVYLIFILLAGALLKSRDKAGVKR